MSLLELPEPPEVTGVRLGSGQSHLRFEDVAQDGRVRLEGIWPAIGPILWGRMEVAAALHRIGAQGVRAVLNYVQLQGGDAPVSVRARCEHEVRWRLGKTLDASGAVNRLLFDTWLLTRAPRGLPGNPGGPPASDEQVLVARAYGQHVFTKPAAPAGQHRVLSLDDPLFGEHEAVVSELRDPARLMQLPDGAVALDPSPRRDAAPIAFGLCHTDGNQHVNFLSYPRLAEEGALRRFAELGESPRRLARRAEVAYRKPCFAGDVVRLVLQAFREDSLLGVVAAFVSEAELGSRSISDFADLPKPHCVARVVFSS